MQQPRYFAVAVPGTNRWQVMERLGKDMQRLVKGDLSRAAAQFWAGSLNG